MEQIRLNPTQKLKNALKYELYKSIPLRLIDKTFKSNENENYFKFYKEYNNLYPQPQWENLIINLKDQKSLSSKNTMLEKIQSVVKNLSNIISLSINFKTRGINV